MPVYEYECEECNEEFEELVSSWKDPPPEKCPLCQTEGKVKRIMSLTAKGKVELYGHDLSAQLMSEANDTKRKIYSGDQNALADVVGHDKLHQNELARTKD